MSDPRDTPERTGPGATTYLRIALAGLGLLIALVSLRQALAPREGPFRVVVRGSIPVPPEQVYPWLATREGWAAWVLDGDDQPVQDVTFTGPAAGQGLTMSWSVPGERQVRLLLAEARPVRAVTYQVFVADADAGPPLSLWSTVDVTLAPRGPSTEIEWVQQGTGRLSRVPEMEDQLRRHGARLRELAARYPAGPPHPR